MSDWNYMVKVVCHKAAEGWAWANGCKAGKGDAKYRCCKCSETGHDKLRER